MKCNPAIAIIGCGMIAGRLQDITSDIIYSHAKAYRNISQHGNMGFYDINSDHSHEMAIKYKGEAYFDIDTLLQSLEPNIVVICSPDGQHFQQIIQVLLHQNRPDIIFIEKPICLDAIELEKILKLEKKYADIAIIVNHSRRFDEKHREIANIIKNKKYGGWVHLGVHLIDFIDLCFNEEIAITDIQYASKSKYVNDDTIHLKGTISGGEIQFRGYDEKYYQLVEVDMHFKRGRIIVTNFGMKVDYYQSIVNSEQENVLFHDKKNSESAMNNQMLTAYNEIFNYLYTGKSEILELVSLDSVVNIMHQLWSIKHQYDRLSYRP